MNQIYMILALLLVMLINTLQGCTLANLKEIFDKQALINGLYKSGIILISFVGLYVSIHFIPELEIFGFTGVEVINGITAIAIVKYAIDIANKLIELIGLSVNDFEKK
ncbi:hypothetical protein B5E87_00250 [Massilimicrobiota sp. An142]|uniref:hypothetical protein n=1 Tax=Massilimicrobiota sp. An142 TaxID=1965564 RepID=UPI000B39BB25|nr:hypothetical protein [Massilimicrobiota sp. An142]OUQ15037.1 hypothetical protein B5E87_00250 [Massilimicrobiota sp. An142]